MHNSEKVFHIRAIYVTVLWEVLTPFMHVQKLLDMALIFSCNFCGIIYAIFSTKYILTTKYFHVILGYFK